ncbi:MAG: creatininase family protein [Burkholderiaceae bacterium]|nr:creatininase family protein [Burkholderiaceae bacterium]
MWKLARRVPLLWVCILCLPMSGWSQVSPGSVYLEELTTQEVSHLLRKSPSIIIIPVGGTEQNGPHMAIGKHNVRVKVLAGRIAAQLGNAIVAPVVAYTPEGRITPPTEHMPFAGTISIPDDAFKELLLSTARSFKQHGFTEIVLFGDSGNYQSLLAAVADGFNRESAKSQTRMHYIADYYKATQTGYISALKAKGLSAAEIGTHAGSADTSLLMAIDSTMVKPDKFAEAAKSGWKGGTLGDPRASTAVLGQLGAEAVVKITVQTIQKAIEKAR